MALMCWLMIVYMFLLQLPNKLHSQSDFTHFDYTIFNGDEGDLIYQGDAHITTRIPSGSADQTFLRLTRTQDRGIPWPLPMSVGRVLYSPPIRLWDQAGRRTANFQAAIRCYVGNTYRPRDAADGLAFFITPAINSTIPDRSTRGHMGLYNLSGTSPVPLFAVELDIFYNIWDPFVRAHLGININSRTSVAFANWGDGGAAEEVEVRITYDARHKLVSVATNQTVAGQHQVTRLEHAYDLKTLLPEWVQIGLSASTGELAAAHHDIRRWTFTSFMVADDVTTESVVPDAHIPYAV